MKRRAEVARRIRFSLCILLSSAVTTQPCAIAVAQAPGSASASAAAQPARGGAATGRIDVTYVLPEADAVIALRPAQVMASPNTAMLPIEVFTAAGLQYLGFDPAGVEEVVAFAKKPANLEPPEYAIALKFAQPFNGGAIAAGLRAHTQRGELAGRAYLQSKEPMLPSLFAPDNRTLVFAPEVTLRKLVETKTPVPPGPLVARVRLARGQHDFYAALGLTNLRDEIQGGLAVMQLQMGDELPTEAKQFFDAPGLINTAELTVNLSNAGPTSFVVQAKDAVSAQRLEAMIGDAIKLYRDAMTAQAQSQFANSQDPVEQAFAVYLQRVSGQWTNVLKPDRNGDNLTFFRVEGMSAEKQMATTAIGGVLVALLLPAVQAAREAARRNASINQLRQLTLALLNFESAKRSLPAHANYSPDGQPLLSWRVHILPYLYEGALYREFHLDEPWDSEHNRTLIARMPAVYANSQLPFPASEGKTNYLAVVGAPCMMNGTAEGVALRANTDGLSNTIMLVEADADRAVEWTKPADLPFNPGDPLAGLGGLRPGGFQVVFCDGHVDFISANIPAATVVGLITIAGGEVPGAIRIQPNMQNVPGAEQGVDPRQMMNPGQ